MDGLCRMIGTDGTIISENGGAYRRGFEGPLHIPGDQEAALEAFEVLKDHFAKEGVRLELLSAQYRFAMWPSPGRSTPMLRGRSSATTVSRSCCWTPGLRSTSRTRV